MDDSMFWDLLDGLDWRHQGDDEQVIAPVVRALSALPLEEIESFEQILAQRLHALDGRAWARAMGSGWRGGRHPISVDGFLYARCVALVNGRDFYESVLADPSQMPKDMEFEALITIAPTAWQTKTGEEPTFLTDVSYETYSNEAGWPEGKPDPESPPVPRHAVQAGSGAIVKYDNGKSAIRKLVRALVTGEIRHPTLDDYLESNATTLVMTPGRGVVPPPEPAASGTGSSPPWRARIRLWTKDRGQAEPQPTALVAEIDLERLDPARIDARLMGIETAGMP